MKVATNNVSSAGMENICEPATSPPLCSAFKSTNKNIQNLTESQTKDQKQQSDFQMFANVNQLNMQIFLPPVFPNQRSIEQLVSKMNPVLSFQEHIDKLKALRNR